MWQQAGPFAPAAYGSLRAPGFPSLFFPDTRRVDNLVSSLCQLLLLLYCSYEQNNNCKIFFERYPIQVEFKKVIKSTFKFTERQILTTKNQN